MIFMYDDQDTTTTNGEKGEHLSFERKDVWDMKWAEVMNYHFKNKLKEFIFLR